MHPKNVGHLFQHHSRTLAAKYYLYSNVALRLAANFRSSATSDRSKRSSSSFWESANISCPLLHNLVGIGST